MLAEVISLTSQPLFSPVLFQYGFTQLYIYSDVSPFGFIGLSHMLKLSLPLPISQFFRVNLETALMQLCPQGGKDIEALREIVQGWELQEVGHFWQEMREPGVVRTIDRAYTALFQAAGRDSEEVLRLLGVAVLWFPGETRKAPERQQPATRALYCPLYTKGQQSGVLVHRKDLHVNRQDQWYFPIAYDEVYVYQTQKEAVYCQLVSLLSQLAAKTAAHIPKAAPLKAESVLKAANRLIAAKKADLDLSSRVEGLYGRLCHVCNRLSAVVPLACAVHFSCPQHLGKGSRDCHLCVRTQREEEDPPSVPLTPSPQPTLHNIIIDLVPASTDPICEVCRRRGEIPLCLCPCLCTACWQAYLATYCVMPRTVKCLLCGKDAVSREVAKIVSIQLENCVKCGNSCPLASLTSTNCRKNCRLCLLCSSEATMSLDQWNRCEYCPKQCCEKPFSGALLSLPCGHDVHSRCLRAGKCPFCA